MPISRKQKNKTARRKERQERAFNCFVVVATKQRIESGRELPRLIPSMQHMSPRQKQVIVENYSDARIIRGT